jgi:hypothetical protein
MDVVQLGAAELQLGVEDGAGLAGAAVITFAL